jgi:DNA-binding response OmpR family regulator
VESHFPSVLLVEDDQALREAVEAVLAGHGYAVKAVPDGPSALAEAAGWRPDAAILDVALPGGCDGFEVGRRLRAERDIPLIYLTASGSTRAKLTAFELGADDYVTKPFAMAELLARLQAVVRRTGGACGRAIRIRDVVVDEASEQAWRAGRPLELTEIELRLLAALARRAGEVMSKTRILTEVWGFDEFSPNLVEVHVSALRRKLERLGPRLLFTVRGAGYVIRP